MSRQGRGTAGSARHQRRALQSAVKRWRDLRCNACQDVLIQVKTEDIRTKAEWVRQRTAAALAKHWADKPSCQPRQETILDHVPPEAQWVEVMCAGCGLIVHTQAVEEARKDPEGMQGQASAALKAHTVASGCSGLAPEGQPPPKRRDARCDGDLHFADCRCEGRPSGAAPLLDAGVFGGPGP